MSKKKVVKGLGNIEQLFSRNLQSPVDRIRINETTIPTSIVIDEDDSMSVTIWKVMHDGKERTLPEVITRVESIVGQQTWYDNYYIDRLNIQAVVHKLVLEENLVLTGNIKNFKYSIKPGCAMPKTPMGSYVPPKYVEPVIAKVQPKVDVTTLWPDNYLDFNVLHMDHGLDTCIWKVCSDYRPHNLGEIAEKVAVAGFKPNVVKDRVITLGLKSGWFKRTNKRTAIMYTLNKACQMPAPTKFKEPETLPTVTKQVSSHAELKDDEYVARHLQLTMQAKQPTMEHAIPVEVTKVDKPTKAEPNKSVGETDGPVFGSFKPRDTIVVPAAFEFCGDEIISVDDTIYQAIVKTMLDGKMYTSGDIILLLEDYLKETNRTKQSVYSALNTAARNLPWFLRNTNGNKISYYLQTTAIDITRSLLDIPATVQPKDTAISVKSAFFKLPEVEQKTLPGLDADSSSDVEGATVTDTIQNDAQIRTGQYIDGKGDSRDLRDLDYMSLINDASSQDQKRLEKDFEGDSLNGLPFLPNQRNPDLNHTTTTTTKEETMNTGAVKTTMLEVVVRIKGVEYTPEQASQIAKAISDASGVSEYKNGFLAIQQQIVLSGVALTSEEMQALHTDFVNTGFLED